MNSQTEQPRPPDMPDNDPNPDPNPEPNPDPQGGQEKPVHPLARFIDRYKESITKRITETYTPLYRPSENTSPLPELLREPMGKQDDAIQGAVVSLRSNRGTTIVGEMGTGKTFIGTAAAQMAGFKRVVVLCPPHLVRKWKREVENTIPEVQAVIVNSLTDLKNIRLLSKDIPIYAIMSRERAKLSYRWKAAYKPVIVTDEFGRLERLLNGQWFTLPACPDCHKHPTDKDGNPLLPSALENKKLFCHHCKSALWTADRSGPKRYPLADYIKHYMKNYFQLCIADEVHEYKGRGSAQGIAAGIIAESCPKTLTLTGTLMGGYSSTLFHLLYRFSPDIRTDFAHGDEKRWVDQYGFIERVERDDSEKETEDGRQSRRKGYRTTIREKPGITPSALFHIIGNTVFLRLHDVAEGLPPYQLTGVCKNETIATNRPRHPWIPAYAGMTEWAR